MDFASPQLRSASAAVHIFGASILAYCFAVRSQSGHVTLKNWRRVPWGRWCTLLVFLDSWLFHVCAGLLIMGYGVSRNQATCMMAIYFCIIIYCSSKILIYCFLIERVYVVWPHTGTRLSSKAYCLCLLMMIGYAVVTVLMMVGRNAFFKLNHLCVIGLKPFASIPLLSYDLFLNITLTSMFLWPLQQAHFRDVRLRKIATRTLWAALVALTTSSVNIAVLTIKHGEELGWVCLASCGLDVTINALVLYWVTGYRPDDHAHNYYLTTINFSVPFTTRSGAIMSSRPDFITNPEIAMPAPVQDKTKPHRHSPAMVSQEMITPQDNHLSQCERIEDTSPPMQVRYNWLSIRDRTTDYPIAHTNTVESVSCHRQVESSPYQEGCHKDGWRWSRWRWRLPCRERDQSEPENDRIGLGLEHGVPFQVEVTTVRQVREATFSCSDGRWDTVGMEEAQVCQ